MRMIENGDAFNDRYAKKLRFHIGGRLASTSLNRQLHRIKKTTIALIKTYAYLKCLCNHMEVYYE